MPKDKILDFPFDVKKYDAKKKNTNYVRATDAMANRGQVITFYHVNSGQNMAFKAFLTTYTDTFRPEWTSEAVFGRADPIYMYKNTVRSITIAFKVPAATQSEAWQNLSKVQKLTTFLYPNYSAVAGSGRTAPAQTISGAPLVRMGFMNIIRTTENGNGQPAPGQSGLIVPNTPATGLLGVIQNVTINHNLDNGSSTGGGFEQSQDGSTSTSILPKFIEVNLDFAVIHETHLGWFDDGTFSNNAFPYNTHNSQTTFAERARNAAIVADNAAYDAYVADRDEEPAAEWRMTEDDLVTPPADTTDAADAAVPDPAREASAINASLNQSIAAEGATNSALHTQADSVRNTLSEIRARNELPGRQAQQAFYNDVDAADTGVLGTLINDIEDNQ